MRIAQVAPLFESVPPQLYGGTERVVSHLTEELVRQGHEVTLFASGDSATSARLVAPVARALRLGDGCPDPIARHVLLLEQMWKQRHQFDVIHSHVGYLLYPRARLHRVPSLTTLHGRLDLADLADVYAEFDDIPVVSISNAQRAPLPRANWMATVYHGLPDEMLSFNPVPGRYLAFLGRISPEKGPDRAIEIAGRVGMRLRIAAKVDPADRQYFAEVVKPMLKQPHVEWVGEISDAEKSDFLGGAHALLFPIDWPEPFGLVLIEAMACGTPIVAYARGSVPEIVEDGVTGFVVPSVDQAVTAVEAVAGLDRARCRSTFEARFSAARMARDYVSIYERLARSCATRCSA